jgi:serine/threonine-protein kinase
VVAPDNLISTVANGTPLQVTAETQGWLKIQSPVEGWVSQALTVTTCNRPGLGTTPSAITAPQPSPPPAPTLQVIAKAQERFQAGQLPVALALLQTLSPSDAGYAQAQRLVQTLPLQWQHGQRVYQAAQGASQQRQWQDVLEHVRQAPDIRYWREQMAPIVKQAIIQQHAQQAPISPN